MISYFENKETKDFKNCAKYWQFYSAHIKIKSDKTNNQKINSLVIDNELVTEQSHLAEVFNNFFTSIKCGSSINYNDCHEFILEHFENLKKDKVIITPEINFKFHETTSSIVKKLLNDLSATSSPGVTGISPRLLIAASSSDKLVELITSLFNLCIKRCYVPNEWKAAVVTPLHKGGDSAEINNYRSISVLPPLAKVFEKLLASQILIYLNANKILYAGQHGFRPGHSCETALHELVSEFNAIRDRNEVGISLLIDFRKAFDLVDSTLLLKKLFHLGFGNNALDLITNYFENRTQAVKLNGTSSSSQSIKLGVPQGSVLGPLFFLLFINDLPHYVNGFNCKLFADDTSLYMSNKSYEKLIIDFHKSTEKLMSWCSFNKLDLNLKKTFIMFITNKRLKLPQMIQTNGSDIQVVSSVKILGIIIDNKLNFLEYASKLRLIVTKKLYSIKRLFFLCTSVKIQFFKSFILPYFDYCSSIFIYFPKVTLQKINNCFNYCLFKLFKFKFSIKNSSSEEEKSFNRFNDLLENYNLFTFQHRLIYRILIFIHKIVNDDTSPVLLKNMINKYEISMLSYPLRTAASYRKVTLYRLPRTRTHYGEDTFNFFINKLLNKFCIDDLKLNLNFFKKRIYNNINLIFFNFIDYFPKLNLYYKEYSF